ncbi:MAG: glycosyltransferase family 4 protein [Candidatus Njordarchaeia archaeon]
MRNFVILSDPALNDFGPTRPPLVLAENLAKGGYKVKFVSPIIGEGVRERLRNAGVEVNSFNVPELAGTSSKRMFLLWLLESGLNYLNSKFLKLLKMGNFGNPFIVNFSNIFHSPSHIWYAQGIFSKALTEIDWTDWPIIYHLGAYMLYPIVRLLDIKHVSKMNAVSGIIVANSRYSAEIYEKLGFRVDSIIYPPLDLNVFKPATNAPNEDFVLTYIGKETDFKVIKTLSSMGVRILGFGGKEKYIPKSLAKEKNFVYLGKVGIDELVQLYSNALFTIFPFTHEPFGYIPIESLACGTPVLTYDKEGPSEVIKEGFNGWLANSRNEIITKALYIWKHGYPMRIRYRAVKSVRIFDEHNIYRKWLALIRHMLNKGMSEVNPLSYMWIWKEIMRTIQSIFVKISHNIQHI